MEIVQSIGNMQPFGPADLAVLMCACVAALHIARFCGRYSHENLLLLGGLLALCLVYEVMDKAYDACAEDGRYGVPRAFDAAWTWFEASVASFLASAVGVLHRMEARHSLREYLMRAAAGGMTEAELLAGAKRNIMSRWERKFSLESSFWFAVMAAGSLAACAALSFGVSDG
jgi:hypothetical protein